MGSEHQPEALEVLGNVNVQGLHGDGVLYIEGHASSFVSYLIFAVNTVSINLNALIWNGGGHPHLCDGSYSISILLRHITPAKLGDLVDKGSGRVNIRVGRSYSGLPLEKSTSVQECGDLMI